MTASLLIHPEELSKKWIDRTDKSVIEADLAYYTAAGFREIAGFACYLGEDYEALHGEPDISDIVAFLKNRK